MPRTIDDDNGPTRDAGRHGRGARRELRFALIGLLFGALALPFLVYAGGAATLGPYEGGLLAFLGKLYGDLAHGAPGALALVAGPYIAFQLLRLTSRPFRAPRD